MKRSTMVALGSALLGGGVAFDPSKASVPLALWYHAPDLALSQGATPTNLPDKSGIGRHATTFSGTTYNAQSLSGRGGVNMSGGYIRSPSFSLTQPFTVFMVVKINAYNLNGRLLDGGTFNKPLISQSPSPNYRIYAGANSLPEVAPGTTTVIEGLHFVRAKFNGVSSKLKVNTTTEGTGNPGADGYTDGITIGNAGSGLSTPANIEFGTLIIYSGLTTDQDDASILQYLKAAYPHKTNLVVFDGDSITTGLGVAAGSDFPSQTVPLLTEPDWLKVNVAAGGRTVATMVSQAARIVDSAYDAQYTNKIVCEQGGINDVFGGASAATVYSNLLTYWAARQAKGYKVVACTVLPASTVTGGAETARTDLNTSIRGDATKYDALADIANDARLQNTANTTYFQADGVHPTAAGAAVIAEIVAAAVNSIT